MIACFDVDLAAGVKSKGIPDAEHLSLVMPSA
jgi:hypothetical protein